LGASEEAERFHAMKTSKGGRSLDALKSVLAERQAKARRTVSETGQTWIRRSEIEQKRVEEYFENQRVEEEKEKAAEEARLIKFNESLAKSDHTNAQTNKAIPGHLYDEALLGDDDAEPPISIGEVIERLREMAQPITLFGETDMQRYRRLRGLEKEAHEGRKNPDVMLLENLHQSQQMQMLQDEEDQLENDEGEDPGHQQPQEADDDGDEDKEDSDAEDPEDIEARLEGRRGQPEPDKSDSDAEDAGTYVRARELGGDKSDSDAEEPTAGASGVAQVDTVTSKDQVAAAKDGDVAVPEVDVQIMDQCDFIRSWVRKATKSWEKELADKPEEEKKKAVMKTELAQHRQCRRDVRPLQKRLRLYVLDEWLLGKIHNIVKHADERDYRAASEAYLDLSIGKAAWPVGLGCGGGILMEDAIGLHDRFNRMDNVKDIAFALNDDVTRKYVQALKRLMNVAQRYWPPDDPSRA